MAQYVFQLGREPELSFAELKCLFQSVVREGDFVFLDSEEEAILSRAKELGGTIKIAEVLYFNIARADILPSALAIVEWFIVPDKKLRIAVDTFVPALSSLPFKIKDALKKRGNSVRVVQHEPNGRVKNATTLHEKLISNGCELMIIPSRNGFILARTVWVQDIDAYSQRDMGRERSMVVGMMPPKLAQIMINLATKGDKKLQIWDSFCGLGTTLIESIHAGYISLLGSDIANGMVQTTIKNTSEKNVHATIFLHDARKLDHHKLSQPTVIVTEGMLWKNFTSANLTLPAALEERKELTILYRDFLTSAHKNIHIQSMTFCLPYWNVGREIVFMPDVLQLCPLWKIDSLCLSGKRYLRHVRPGQSVGREIVILRRGTV